MEHAFLLALQSIRGPVMTAVANVLSFLAEETVLVVVLVVVYLTRSKKAGFGLFCSLMGAQLVTNTLKPIIHRPRPFMVYSDIDAGRLSTATGWSFPSGHTTGAAAFLPALGRLSGRTWATVLGVILAVLVGLSRNMLGVHWPTDCLIGLAIGLISSLVLLPRLMALYEDEEKRCTTCLVAAPVLAVVALVPCILIQLGIIEEIDGKDLMKIAALSSGAMAGVLLETRKAGFKEARGLKRGILNSLICLAGAGIIMVADSLVPAPVDAVGSLILHLLLGFWAVGLYPFMAVRTGLMDKAS